MLLVSQGSAGVEMQQEPLQLLRHGRGLGMSWLFGAALSGSSGEQVLVDQAAVKVTSDLCLPWGISPWQAKDCRPLGSALLLEFPVPEGA